VAHGKPVGRARRGRMPASLKGTADDSFAHGGTPSYVLEEQAYIVAHASVMADRRKTRGAYSSMGASARREMNVHAGLDDETSSATVTSRKIDANCVASARIGRGRA
jgi:hypothetical protein